MKLIGNSGYDMCIINLEKHKKVQYFNASEVSRAVNDCYFCDLNELEDFLRFLLIKKKHRFQTPNSDRVFRLRVCKITYATILP